MAYSAKVICDSTANVFGTSYRLTTLEVTIPRIVLAEFNTHRMFSRNSASSRAIPVKNRINDVLNDPFVPENFGVNKKGMQSTENLSGTDEILAREAWMKARDSAVRYAARLAGLDGVLNDAVHKQIANRLLEPFMWQTIIVTATEFDNFFALRCHPEAQAEIRKPAEMMREALRNSTPIAPQHGYHLPFIDERDGDLSLEDKIKVSVGRCARVSYLTHDGKRDPLADIELYDRLLQNGHMSPFEHVAKQMSEYEDADRLESRTGMFEGNFQGWVQHRKQILFESNYANALAHRQ